nr:DinB family protein [Paenibacillus sp. PL91]
MIVYTTLEQFATEWEQETRRTENVLKTLTDDSLAQAIMSGRRTLGTLAWHLVTSIGFISTLGLELESQPQNNSAPDSAAEIAKAYSKIARSLLDAVQSQWNEDTLAATQTVMGEEWSNGASLHFAVLHQAHHRGQMTVLMRQAGLLVPEIYGPTYESWLQKGMEPLV